MLRQQVMPSGLGGSSGRLQHMICWIGCCTFTYIDSFLRYLYHRSSIWAPQPRAYNIGATVGDSSKSGISRDDPISEGEEADEEFLPQQKAMLLSKIRE